MPKHYRLARPSTLRQTPDQRWRGTDTELRPSAWRGSSGRAGFIDEIKNQHSRLAGFLNWRARELGRAQWELEPAGGQGQEETREEVLLREILERVLIRECVTNAYQRTSSLRGGFGRVMQVLATRDEYGTALFERTWHEDPAAYRGLRLELFPIHQSTIGQWEEDRDTGELLGLRQHTARSVEFVPAHRLYVFPFGAAEGEYEGWTRYRALGLLWEVVKQSTHSYALAQRREAGILIVRNMGDAGWAPEEIALVEEFLEQTEDGTAMSGRMPSNTTAEFLVNRAAASDPTKLWSYFDALVDHLCEQHANSLGATAGTGARALGDTFVRKEEAAWSAFLAELGNVFAETVLPDLRSALGFGEHVRCPSLRVAKQAQSLTGEDRRRAIFEGIDRGVFSPGPLLAREIAEQIGLPEDVISEQSTLLRAAAQPAATPLEGGVVADLSARAVGAHSAAVTAARGATAAPIGVALPGCGCGPTGSLTLASRPTVTVTDYDGVPFEYYRELTDLERLVSWDDQRQQRAELDTELELQLEDAVRRHRRDLVAAIDGGSDEGLSEQEIDRLIEAVRRELVSVYRGIIERYVVAVTQLGASTEATNAERQTPEPVPGDYENDAIARLLDKSLGQLNAIRRGLDRVSQQIAMRVEEDIVRGWGATLTTTRAADVRPIQTAKGLSRDAKRLGNRAESSGRMIEAVLGSAALGLVPYESTRTAIRDNNLCEHCLSLDGRAWLLDTPERIGVFLDDEAADVPDPLCEGGDQCRCGHLLRYRQRPMELSALPPRVRVVASTLRELVAGYLEAAKTANLPSIGVQQARLR